MVDLAHGKNCSTRSTFGYVFLLNNVTILWSIKKQTCIALSTMEAKFIACSAAVQQAVWLKRFMKYFGIIGKLMDPVQLCCDSQVAVAYMEDLKHHFRTKHNDTKYNFVRPIIAREEITF